MYCKALKWVAHLRSSMHNEWQRKTETERSDVVGELAKRSLKKFSKTSSWYFWTWKVDGGPDDAAAQYASLKIMGTLGQNSSRPRSVKLGMAAAAARMACAITRMGKLAETMSPIDAAWPAASATAALQMRNGSRCVCACMREQQTGPRAESTNVKHNACQK